MESMYHVRLVLDPSPVPACTVHPFCPPSSTWQAAGLPCPGTAWKPRPSQAARTRAGRTRAPFCIARTPPLRRPDPVSPVRHFRRAGCQRRLARQDRRGGQACEGFSAKTGMRKVSVPGPGAVRRHRVLCKAAILRRLPGHAAVRAIPASDVPQCRGSHVPLPPRPPAVQAGTGRSHQSASCRRSRPRRTWGSSSRKPSRGTGGPHSARCGGTRRRRLRFRWGRHDPSLGEPWT